MESLGLAKLENYKIMAQECSKSIFVPFINMVPQIPPIAPAPEPLLSSICVKLRCGSIGKNGFVIIVIRNSPRDIDVLRKISISYMWIILLHRIFLMMLRNQ